MPFASYLRGELNRTYVAEKIFGSSELKEKLESIVHPAVREDFEHWKLNSSSTVVFKESALVLETGDSSCEHVVSVVADEDVRISRVSQRPLRLTCTARSLPDPSRLTDRGTPGGSRGSRCRAAALRR